MSRAFRARSLAGPLRTRSALTPSHNAQNRTSALASTMPVRISTPLCRRRQAWLPDPPYTTRAHAQNTCVDLVNTPRKAAEDQGCRPRPPWWSSVGPVLRSRRGKSSSGAPTCAEGRGPPEQVRRSKSRTQLKSEIRFCDVGVDVLATIRCVRHPGTHTVHIFSASLELYERTGDALSLTPRGGQWARHCRRHAKTQRIDR